MAGRPLALAALVLGVSCAQQRTDLDRGRDAFQLGWQALRDGRDEAAARDFAEAVRLMPDDAFAALDLGVALQHLGRRDEARAAYRRAIELGKTVRPRDVTDPLYAAQTVGELAADDLASLDGGTPPAGSGGAAQR